MNVFITWQPLFPLTSRFKVLVTHPVRGQPPSLRIPGWRHQVPLQLLWPRDYKVPSYHVFKGQDDQKLEQVTMILIPEQGSLMEELNDHRTHLKEKNKNQLYDSERSTRRHSVPGDFYSQHRICSSSDQAQVPVYLTCQECLQEGEERKNHKWAMALWLCCARRDRDLPVIRLPRILLTPSKNTSLLQSWKYKK